MAGSLTSMLGWGAVGGALPTISKVAGTYGANFAAPAPEWRGVLIAIALYAGIGSVVARAMDNPEMKQALFAGIAAPAIVASILAGVTDSRSVNPASAQSTNPTSAPTKGGLLITSAFAQSPPAPPTADSMTYVVEAAVDGGVPVKGIIRVEAVLPGGDSTYVGFMPIAGPFYRSVLDVPKQTTALRFISKQGDVSYEVPVHGSDRVLLKILPRPTTNQDLLWALGSQRVFDIGGISSPQFN